MKLLSIISLFFCFSILNAQNYWQKVENNKINTEVNYTLNEEAFKGSLEKGETLIPINNRLKVFKIQKISNFEEKLAQKYPEITSYIGYQKDNPNTKVFISSSPKRISTTVVDSENFLSLKKNSNNLYSSQTVTNSEKLNCLTNFSSFPINLYAVTSTNDQVLRTYKIAISVNGEYTQYFGGTKQAALAAINETLSNINAVYQSELSVRFILVNDNDKIIYTDPSTDPYSDASSGTTGSWLNEVQNTITQEIGESNYDIGHLLAGEGDVGLSGCIGCIGVDGEKGKAFTAAPNGKPEGARYDIDFVAHEIGHQLGANHTFSYYEGVNTNFEPGSGTTIMGYAGLEGFPMDAQLNSDHYFHFISISQISENLKNKNVGSITSINNLPPTVEAGENYYIPAGTAFKLTGSASDTDSNQLLYSWEQADGSTLREFHYAQPYSSTGQLFRSFPPTRENFRYFPSFPLILDGRLDDNFESVPQVDREMNFNLIVRDNETFGQNNSDNMKIYVRKENQAFSVKKSNSLSLRSGDTFNLKWNIANTNQSPYNVSLVNILWSLDGGKNFEMLANNQSNNGSYNINLPEGVISEEVYFMVEAVDNIFFAVSQMYSLGYLKEEVCEKYNFNNLPLTIPDGISAEQFGEPAVSSVNIPDDFNVKQIKVNVNIEHPYIGDLHMYLTHPNNEQVVLYNQQCEDQTTLNTIFLDRAENINCDAIKSNGVRSAQRIDAFNQYSPKGKWTLSVLDGSLQDTGIIKSANLELCKAEYQKINIDKVDEKSILLYPNPAHDIVKFQGLENSSFQYFIYNALGQLIFNGQTNDTEINVERLIAGIYFIVVQQGSKTHYFKLMKN